MRLKTNLIFILLLGFAVLPSFGQKKEKKSTWAFQSNLQHQDIAFSFYVGQLGQVDPVYIRPYTSLEVQRLFYDNEKAQRFLSLKTGLYRNLYHDRWISLQLGLGIQKYLNKKIFYALRGELGFANAKNTDIQYQLEDGKWVQTRNGAPSSTNPLFGLRLDIGYRALIDEMPLDIILLSQINGHKNSIFESYVPYYSIGLGLRTELKGRN
ncbi:MAG: hypothetical protein MRZ79_05880 [Bacteroidia bacterium]|nr:hypothetical protein [Bacteroidia bacterium]